MRSRAWICASVVVAGLVSVASLVKGSAESGKPPAPVAGKVSQPWFAGSASCSASFCHGGQEAKDAEIQRNEYTTCAHQDRHTRAYAVLLGERAQTMARNLAPTNADGKVIPAHEDARCLACHSLPQSATDPALASLRRDGVGCEACHGPAQKPNGWLAAHTVGGWAQQKSAQQKAEAGYIDLANLTIQAQTCAGCHVGAPPKDDAPARDLNHDLMAAGHPRLTFELASYRNALPPHWNVKKKGQEEGAYQARIWVIGQLATARATLELTKWRAEQAQAGKAPWPEFAEYNCFACHSDLRHPSPRRETENYFGKRTPGALPYSRWAIATLPALASMVGEEFRLMETGSLDRLVEEMSKPEPDAKTVADMAGSQATLLSKFLEAPEKPLKPDLAKKLAGALQFHGSNTTWDDAYQITLACLALNRDTLARDPNGKLAQNLRDLLKALSFPSGYESPAAFGEESRFLMIAKSLEELLKSLK